MPSIIIQNMGGIAPRISPRLLPAGMATRAQMTKLWSGGLRPFLELAPMYGVPLPQTDLVRTVYLLVDKWLAWATDVNVVTGFAVLGDAGHIYYTGDGTPKQTTYDLVKFGPPTPIPGSTYPIGVWGPQAAYTPTVAVVGAPGGDPLVRSYVYTLYSVNDEESVPSLPSQLVTVETGQTVDVGNFQDLSVVLPVGFYPPDFSNVESLRLYRTFNNEFHFVAEIAKPFPATYNDAILDEDLGEVLQSQHYYPPPSGLQGLIGLACGSLAGFGGIDIDGTDNRNKVFFSEPYQPGAWPPEYVKIFDYPIVALGTYGQTLVVATTGYTYLVSGNDPRSFAVARVPDPYPCVSKRSMVSTDSGVIYASADGLIFIGVATAYTQNAGVNVITREVATHDEWQAYNPSTIWGVIYDGRYYGFYLNPNNVVPQPIIGRGFIFDPTPQRLPGLAAGSEYDRDNTLVDLDFYASAGFANPQVPLKLVVRGGVITPNVLKEWDGGPGSRTYVWRSKQFSFPYIVTFSAAKIIFNPTEVRTGVITFQLLDGATGEVLYSREVTSTKPFRLPSLSPRTEWMIEIISNRWVEQIKVAASYADLIEQKAA